MLVLEVYNKAEWEISDDQEDSTSRARKSEFSFTCHVSPPAEYYYDDVVAV